MSDDAGVFLTEIIQFLINEADTFVDLAKVQVYDLKLVPLDANEFIAAKSTKKDPYFHYKYETLKKRRGHKKAIIAIARKMLVAIYHMIRDDADFLPVDHEEVLHSTKKQKGLNLDNVIAFLKEQGADDDKYRTSVYRFLYWLGCGCTS